MGKKCELCGDKEIKVYFCPKCKSTDVKFAFGLGNLFGVIPRQRCGKCGREGMFPILVTSKNKLRGRGQPLPPILQEVLTWHGGIS